MFKQWLLKKIPVIQATNEEELSAIYRFRYDVYVNEFNLVNHPTAHHETAEFSDDDDLATDGGWVRHLYTKRRDSVTGVARVRGWEPGEIPAAVKSQYSLDLFPNIDELRIAELSRMMIMPTERNKLIYPSLLLQGFEMLARDFQTDLAFLYTVPGLVQHYGRQGARFYGAYIAGQATVVPMVVVMSDYRFLRSKKSVVAPIAKKYYGRGKNRVLDMDLYEPIFDPSKLPVKWSGHAVQNEVDRFLDDYEGVPAMFRDVSRSVMKSLLSSALVLDVPEGTTMTMRDMHDREVYFVLEGKFESSLNERVVKEYTKGEVFGVLAFFTEDGRRSSRVKSTTAGRVLVFKRKFLSTIAARDPEAAVQILSNLGLILAERLRSEFERSTLTERLAAHLMYSNLSRDDTSLAEVSALVSETFEEPTPGDEESR